MPQQMDIRVNTNVLNRVSRLVGRRTHGTGSAQADNAALAMRLQGNEHGKQLQILAVDVSASLDLKELCTKICRDVPMLLSSESCTVSLRNQSLDERFTTFTRTGDATECNENVIDELAEHVLSSGLSASGVGTANVTEGASVSDALATKLGLGAYLAVPISDLDGECMGVLRVAHPLPADGTAVTGFTNDDKCQLEEFTPFCAVAIQNAEIFATALLECKWSNVLLELSRNLFEDLESKEGIISKIMVNAAALVSCDRCSVFMIDFETKELFSELFDAKVDEEEDPYAPKAEEIRFPMDRGIAGHVATTGETLNIMDAYSDPRFNQNVDKQTGFVTNTILCMPIKNVDGKVIGVAQLVNSANGIFTSQDEKLFEAFAIYCGLSITAAALYEETSKANAKHCVALDVLSYHATANDADTNRLADIKVPTAAVLGINSMEFDVKTLLNDDKLVACVRMFVDTGMVSMFRLPYLTLCRWLLSVEKNYRDVTYHNWDHAFNVTQTMYHMLMKEDVQVRIEPAERLALLIACLCHDLDHRGTNNHFEDLKKSKLHMLYTTSTMECHHFNMCMTILEGSENNVLVNLGVEQYKNVVSKVRKAILATDVSTYLKTRGTYHSAVETKTFDWKKDTDRDLLRAMMMTASDLSAVLRPWEVQQRVAESVYVEFFQQGSAERNIGHTPADLYDETKACDLPKMQLGFLAFICKPVYTSLALQFPALTEYGNALELNRVAWEAQKAAGPYKMKILNARIDPRPSDKALWAKNVEQQHAEGAPKAIPATNLACKARAEKRDARQEASKACAIL